MRKKIVTGTIVALFITAGLLSCGSKGGKYGDVKDVMSGMAEAMTGLTNSLGKAGNAKDCASALNKFSASMEKLQPKMLELEKKYPEMKNKKDAPPELKADMQKLEDAAKKMVPTFMKISKYAKDPEVMKAMKNMQTVMNRGVKK